MRLWSKLFGPAALILSLSAAACTDQPAAGNSANGVAANASASAPSVNTAPSANARPASVSDTGGVGASQREPAAYVATYNFSAQATGAQQGSVASTIEVARSGDNRRWTFDSKAPGLGKIVILDRADKRYLILEGRRKYVELTPDVTGGVSVPHSMTPGSMVEQLQRSPGVENLGEEQVAGRTAVKYRVAGQTQSGTQAGQVSGESFFWIDKETGLPVKVQAASAASGQVRGVTGGAGGLELTNLQTTADPSLFELPQGYTPMSEQEVKQWQALISLALQQVMGAAGVSGAAPGAR